MFIGMESWTDDGDLGYLLLMEFFFKKWKHERNFFPCLEMSFLFSSSSSIRVPCPISFSIILIVLWDVCVRFAFDKTRTYDSDQGQNCIFVGFAVFELLL